MKAISRLRLIWFCSTLWVMLCPCAEAREFAWTQEDSGAFDDPNKWSSFPYDGYPTGNDLAIFGFPGSRGRVYTVTCNGASSGLTEVTDNVTFQLNSGVYNVGEMFLNGAMVLQGAGAMTGAPFTVGASGSILVDGAGLTMNAATFNTTGQPLTGRNNAKILSSGQIVNCHKPLLESGAEWRHTGALDAGWCLVNSGARLSADELTVTPAQLDGGHLQAGHLTAWGVQAKNAATIITSTVSLTGSRPTLIESGAHWSISGTINADTAEVEVQTGARVSAMFIGPGGTYTIDGEGSQLVVGSSITGASVGLRNKGSGIANSLTLAAVVVRDAGSIFNFHTTAEDTGVLIMNGGRISGGLLRGPMSAAAEGRGFGFFTIQDEGSALVLAGNLEMGSFAQANFLVQNGGSVECELGVLDGGRPGGGSNAEVFGADSLLKARAGLIVGENHGQATLNLNSGGRVEVVGSAMAVGLQAGGQGSLTVDGGLSSSPSLLDTRLAVGTTIGVAGKGLLRARNRGRILTSQLRVGDEAGSDGTLEIIGVGTRLEVGGTLEIGQAGRGRMTIFSGGLATAPDVRIGSNTGTNLLRLTGFGSTMTVAKSMQIGVTGSGQLSIEQGAVVDVVSADVAVARELGSTGVVTVDGPAVLLGPDGALVVGVLGNGTLNVIDGGSVVFSRVEIGQAHGATGTVTVSSASSLGGSEGHGVLQVGQGAPGTLNVTSGGEVSFDQAGIGGGPGANGIVTVSGTNSVLHAIETVSIGGYPGLGRLTAYDGGLVLADLTLEVNESGVLNVVGGAAVVGESIEGPVADTVIVADQGEFRLAGGLLGSVIVETGGSFMPGASPGKATVVGNVTFGTGTMMEAELGGGGAGVSHDLLDATGTVTLAGRLEIVFRDGFAPTNGQTFDLVRGGLVTGAFSEVSIKGLAPGFTYTLARPGDASLRLTATSAGVAVSVPELTLTREVGGSLVLSWPDYVEGWNLQHTLNLQPGGWNPMAAPGNRLSVPPLAPSGFFRLAKP